MLIDQGLEQTRRFVFQRFGTLLDDVVRDRLDLDNKSILQEMVQGLLGITPTYRIVETGGTHHEPLFTVEVSAGEQVLGRGIGHNKREAEQLAAAEALVRMDKSASSKE
jgi:ribonuclease-3